MTTSKVVEISVPDAVSAAVTEDELIVNLSDGRKITVPNVWYPRLSHATPTERANLCLVGGGEAIHWPGLDEFIGVEGLLAGRTSQESGGSFQRWLASRS